MDKDAALKILGLSPEACLEDAKQSFRNLAKKHHPDRFTENNAQREEAQARMTDIILAFRYLSPLLKTGPGKRHKQSEQDKPASKPGETSRSKESVTRFMSDVFSMLKETLRPKKKVKRSVKSVKKTPPPKRPLKRKPPSFTDILKDMDIDLEDGSAADKSKKRKAYQKKRSQSSYSTYVRLKKKMASQKKRGDMSVGRVESVSPVERVKRVGDD